MQEPGTHKLTEALKGQQPSSADPAASSHGPPEPQGHGSNPHEVAEDARRQHEARPDATPNRDQKLTEIGRGEQTHG